MNGVVEISTGFFARPSFILDAELGFLSKPENRKLQDGACRFVFRVQIEDGFVVIPSDKIFIDSEMAREWLKRNLPQVYEKKKRLGSL